MYNRRKIMSKKVQHYVDLASIYVDIDPDLTEQQKYDIARKELLDCMEKNLIEIVEIEINE
jgi:hypothetical protein